MKEIFQNTKFSITLLFILLAISVFFALKNLYDNYNSEYQSNRDLYLDQNLEKATLEFKEGIDKYAILVSSMRSHILSTNKAPTDVEIQEFIINQLQFTDYAHSIIINYFDTTHTFIFSISESDLSPNNLKGVQLRAIREQTTIDRMNVLLKTTSLVSFPPLNLVEGFVGYPIDFRVIVDEEVVGYVAPLIDIKNLIEPILTKDVNHEFTYQFSFGDGIQFDRERVYNESEVHHSRVDSLNLKMASDQYKFSSIDAYGLNFNIGIAFREDASDDVLFSFVQTSFSIILSLAGLSFLLIYLFFLILQSRNNLKISNNDLTIKNSILKKYVYAASHDLKQPLINIKNFQSLFKKKYNENIDQTGNKYIEVIGDNIKFMESMLDDFLIYANILKRETKKEKIDLNDLIDEIKTIFTDKNVSYNIAPLPKVDGNRSQLQRLFQNLFSNAIKFNRNDLIEIVVTCKHLYQHIEITVSDNGIGIPEEHLPFIFEEFQRLHKKEFEGTGLGLTICKEIVANHNGSISAARNNIGGTDIIFTIKK